MAAAVIRSKYSIQCLFSVSNFQHLLRLYSSKSPNQSYVNYLVNNLGFSHQQAVSTSTKIRTNINIFKFCNKANSVVAFLKQHGFEDTQIIKLVSSYPRILVANVDETLIPKFKLLQDYGFSGSNLVSVILTNPLFVSKHMDDIFLGLRAVLGSDENLTKLLRKPNMFLSRHALENLVSNVALLNNEYGVDIHVIRTNILKQPESFLRKPEFFRNTLIKVEEELGIPRNSGMFFSGVYLLCMSTKKAIDSKCELLKSFGWTEYDVSELMRRNPWTLLLSEENMRKKLTFFMTELGYKSSFLAANGVLLTYSLEKRLEPRGRVLIVLKEKGLLDYKSRSAFNLTETRFLKKLIEPFKEDVPGLLQLYEKSKGCSNVDAKPSCQLVMAELGKDEC